MIIRRARAFTAAAAALLAAIALTACGDDAGGERATELRLGYFPNVTHAPALVGLENGIFTEHLGEDVTLSTTTFNAGPSAIEALFSGAIDATYIGPNPAINGWAQSGGAALHIVAGTASGGAGLVVRPGIESAADLPGTTIATPQLGNTQDVALRYWLQQQGYETDQQGGGDVSILPIPNAEIITGYAAEELDGAFVPEPNLSVLVLEHGAEVLLDERDEWPGGEFVTAHLIVRTEFLDENPELVSDLLAGHVASVDYVNDHPAEAQEAFNAHLSELTGNAVPEDVLAAAFGNITFTVDPIAPSLYGSAAHAEAVGLLEPVDLTGIYDLGPLNELLRAAGRTEVSGDPA